jgi:protein-disulfide isomerase
MAFVRAIMKRLKSIVDISVTVLVVVAAGLVIWRQFAPAGSGARAAVEDASGSVPAEIVTSVRGTGPVALVEFADFECPFCGRHARDVEPMIRQAFIDTGILRQVFLNFPLSNHPRAVPASEAALCAGKQGKFWEMHDAVFQNQAALADADFTELARELRLDIALFTECITGGKERSLIDRHKSLARALSVQSTPSFFLGIVKPDGSVELKKRINGALSFDKFRSTIMDVTPEELRERISAVALNVPGSVGGGTR